VRIRLSIGSRIGEAACNDGCKRSDQYGVWAFRSDAYLARSDPPVYTRLDPCAPLIVSGNLAPRKWPADLWCICRQFGDERRVVRRREGQDGVQDWGPARSGRLAETDIRSCGASELDMRTKDDHIRFLSHGDFRCLTQSDGQVYGRRAESWVSRVRKNVAAPFYIAITITITGKT
jgi:hypothetical protein